MVTEKRVIKKYPNRRLYDTATSSYITLADVRQLVLDHVEVEVVDAKTQEDLTRSVLLQIILEEENGAVPMFSYEVLTQFIRLYGQAMQGVMGPFLERNLQFCSQVQQKMQEQVRTLYGDNKAFNTKLWSELLSFQRPIMQNMLSNYLEQSAGMYLEVQGHMQEQAKQFFSRFGLGDYPVAAKDNKGDSNEN